MPTETIREMERVYLLKNVDTHWMDHIDNMDQLKSGIRLRSYGQHDPVVEYRIEGFDMFDEMIESIREDTVKMMLIMPKKVYEVKKRQDAIEAAKRMALKQAQAAHQVVLNNGEDEEPKESPIEIALKREFTPPNTRKVDISRASFGVRPFSINTRSASTTPAAT